MDPKLAEPPGTAPVPALLTLLANDLDAGFAELVRQEQRAVYTLALRTTGHWADAEDLAAETFLRAYQALLGYSQARILELRPRAWLLTIALNSRRNAVRAAGRRPHLVPTDSLPEVQPDATSVEQLVEAAEQRHALDELLDQLPSSQRVAVTLRHVIGLPLVEVAEVMRCPDGTAKSHVSRGLSRLRKLCQSDPVIPEPVPTDRRRQS